MASTVRDLMSNVAALQYNPAAIQRAVLQTLADVSNNTISIVDPTNPVVFTLETGAVLVAAAMMKNEANTRKQYPYSAQEQEDLYLHMSDLDYIGRFATPSTVKFSLLLPKDEVLAKMVMDISTGIRKIVIPRNTYFTIANVIFSLQYPIEVRQLAHGGLQVVYAADKTSPLQTLSTNIIDYEIRQIADSEWIFIEFDTQQFSIVSQTGSLTAATDFKVNITLEDQYCFTRVYVEDISGNWAEIATTHTDQIYDIGTPTAVLRVADGVVSVSIPQIYTGTGLLNRGIRIDVYQTKGKLDMILSEYPASSFSATWQTYDKADDTIYVAPLKTLRSVVPYSDKIVTGGSDAMSFETLRKKVIQNAIGPQNIPITNVQIESALTDKGYDVVKNIDNITNRVFIATKGMPVPTDINLITAAAASIETVSLTISNAILLDSVKDNGTSITITPDTVYRNVNGIASMISSAELAALMALPVDKRALAVTNGDYLYTPFHYVLDTSDNEFEARPYYLDDPVIETKLFVTENDTTLIQVATKVYGIVRTANGYAIQVITDSGDAYKALPDNEVHVQLAFVPAGEKDLAYLNGTLVGMEPDTGERIFNFDLSTTFDVDSNDNLMLSKFLLYTTEPRFTGAPLKLDMNIIHSTSTILGQQWIPGAVDLILGRFLLPARIAGITQEKLRVKFGDALGTLWSRARSVISSVPYKAYEVDIPALYEKDIYQRDANGAAFWVGSNGELESVILHHAGDTVLDVDGNPTYRFRKGDTVLDGNGNPTVSDTRGMLRQIDIMLIEGAYRFATDITGINYRNSLTKTVVGWLTNDLEAITQQLLERTRIYFYPKTTMGTLQVVVAGGAIKTVNAGQAFQVGLDVSAIVFNNLVLRERLEKATIQLISDELKKPTPAISSLVTTLRAAYGTDVIDVQVSGLGGVANYPALTVLNDEDRLSIRKRLAALPDGSLNVQEDVTINFNTFVQKT